MDVEVVFQPSGRRVRVPAGTTLIEAARRAGLPVASACGASGLCARCGMRILAGGEQIPPADPEEDEARQRNRVDPALRLSCRVALFADAEATAPYW